MANSWATKRSNATLVNSIAALWSTVLEASKELDGGKFKPSAETQARVHDWEDAVRELASRLRNP